MENNWLSINGIGPELSLGGLVGIETVRDKRSADYTELRIPGGGDIFGGVM